MTQANRVLVVDDEETIRALLNDTLTSEGLEVIEAASAEEALKELGAHQFQLVMSDIRMPGLSGIQLLERIRLAELETEVVIMTSNASTETAVEAIRLGAYDYLLKPFESLEVVSSVVHRAIERRRLSSENENLMRALRAKNEELLRATQRAAQVLADGHAVHAQIERLLASSNRSEAAKRVVEGVIQFGWAESAAVWLLEDARLSPTAAQGVDLSQMPRWPLPFPDSSAPVELALWFSQGRHRNLVAGLRMKFSGGELVSRPLGTPGRAAGLLVMKPVQRDDSVSSRFDELFPAVAGHVLGSFAIGEAPVGSVSANGTLSPKCRGNGSSLLPFDYFQEQLGFEIARSRRYHHRFTLIMISLTVAALKPGSADLDGILNQIAVRILSRVRSTDLVTACGKKYFLLFPETAIEDARKVEISLHQTLAEFAALPEGKGLEWTEAALEYPKDGDTPEALFISLESLSAHTPNRPD